MTLNEFKENKDWIVTRTDNNGREYFVQDFAEEKDAKRKVEEFESGYPHHQGYFVTHRSKLGKDVIGI